MKNKYTGPARVAIKESIEHWEEIQRLVNACPDKGKKLAELFDADVIGEETCALCQYSIKFNKGKGYCSPCPLFIEGNGCEMSTGPFANVGMSTDANYSAEHSIAAMLAVLKALLELKEKDGHFPHNAAYSRKAKR